MPRRLMSHVRRMRHRQALSWPMIIIGLTGSIGMGKTTAAKMMNRMNIAVFDADAAVHQLMGPGGAALSAVEKRFPDVVGSQGVDRPKLGAAVFGDDQALADLEAILHPMVGQKRAAFLRAQAMRRASYVVLDIPLLLESRKPPACDKVVVISAPKFLQRQRVLRRRNMTEEKFFSILQRQMPDEEKRRHADVVVYSGLGKHVTWRILRRFLNRLPKPVFTNNG